MAKSTDSMKYCQTLLRQDSDSWASVSLVNGIIKTVLWRFKKYLSDKLCHILFLKKLFLVNREKHEMHIVDLLPSNCIAGIMVLLLKMRLLQIRKTKFKVTVWISFISFYVLKFQKCYLPIKTENSNCLEINNATLIIPIFHTSCKECRPFKFHFLYVSDFPTKSIKTRTVLIDSYKIYGCTHCNKEFRQLNDLRRHLRIHSGERPYSCECGKRFRLKHHLQGHVKRCHKAS